MKDYKPGEPLTEEDRTAGFKEGLPRYVLDQGSPVFYQIIVAPEQELRRAFVDTSTQYRGEGVQWQDANTREYISKHRVIGWRDVNADSLNESTTKNY